MCEYCVRSITTDHSSETLTLEESCLILLPVCRVLSVFVCKLFNFLSATFTSNSRFIVDILILDFNGCRLLKDELVQLQLDITKIITIIIIIII
jgi:hypothetical protein